MKTTTLTFPRRSYVKKQVVQDWLRTELENGPVAVEWFREQAALNGLNWQAVVAAKQELRVVSQNLTGYSGDWTWQLPPEGREQR